MGKEIVNQVQGVKRVPYRINPKRNTPRQILIKLTKIKHQKKTIKSSKGNPIHLTDDLSAKTLQARREWQDIFKVLKGKKIYNQDYSIRQRPHSKLMEKEKAFQTSKS